MVWPRHSLGAEQIYDVVENLSRKYINVEVEAEFKRGPYNGTWSLDMKRFHVAGVRNEDADDYHLYITNMPRDESLLTDLETVSVSMGGRVAIS